MTIQYSDNFFKILAHWRGSAWKAVWRELLVWLILYYIVKMALDFGLSQPLQTDAKKVVAIFQTYTDRVPLQFILGFYVSQILSRWWQQIEDLPWPDDIMAWVSACLPGADSDSNLRRHLVARYLVLSEILVLRSISTRTRKRFPNVESLVAAGLMTDEEFKLYEGCPCPNAQWQLPLQWALNGVLIPLNHREQNPVTLAAMGHMVNAFNAFRCGLRRLFVYNWIPMPLVYTQTVSVVVYGYFALCLIGRQCIGQEADFYVPVLAILQFVFYVGWFKVSQHLMLPFGEDDDDIELNYLIDRHIMVAMTMANYVTTNNPSISEDRYYKAIQKCGVDGSKFFNLAYTNLALSDNRDRPPKLLTSVKIDNPQIQLTMSYKPPPYYSSRQPKESESPSLSSSANPTQSTECKWISTLKGGIARLGKRDHKEPMFF